MNYLEDEKSLSWKNQQEIIKRINTVGGLQNFLDKYPEIKEKIFREEKNVQVACMDEGTPSEVRLAGSGILMGENMEEALENAGKVFIKLIKNEKIHLDSITSHDGCGAAKIAFAKLSLENQKKYHDNPDEYGQEFSKKLAAKISKEIGINTNYCHILAEKMARGEFHDAICIYYDLTGKILPQNSQKIPKGFITNRAYFGTQNALAETQVAVDIALGDHGFGLEKFSRSPFKIYIISKRGLDIGLKEQSELEKIVSSNQGKTEFIKIQF